MKENKTAGQGYSNHPNIQEPDEDSTEPSNGARDMGNKANLLMEQSSVGFPYVEKEPLPANEVSDHDWLLFGVCAECKYHSKTYDGGICHVMNIGCSYNNMLKMIDTKIEIKEKALEYKKLVEIQKRIKAHQFTKTDYEGNPIHERV